MASAAPAKRDDNNEELREAGERMLQTKDELDMIKDCADSVQEFYDMAPDEVKDKMDRADAAVGDAAKAVVGAVTSGPGMSALTMLTTFQDAGGPERDPREDEAAEARMAAHARDIVESLSATKVSDVKLTRDYAAGSEDTDSSSDEGSSAEHRSDAIKEDQLASGHIDHDDTQGDSGVSVSVDASAFAFHGADELGRGDRDDERDSDNDSGGNDNDKCNIM